MHEMFGYYCDRLCMHKKDSLLTSSMLLFIPPQKHQNTLYYEYNFRGARRKIYLSWKFMN